MENYYNGHIPLSNIQNHDNKNVNLLDELTENQNNYQCPETLIVYNGGSKIARNPYINKQSEDKKVLEFDNDPLSRRQQRSQHKTEHTIIRHTFPFFNHDNFYVKINAFTKNPHGREGHVTSTTFFTQKDFSICKKANPVIYIGGLYLNHPETIDGSHSLILKEDKYIERNHIKLDCTNGFHEFQPFRKGFYEFLKVTHPKKGTLLKTKLPLELYKMIFDYLYEPRYFTIADMGSIYGTYIKIRYNEKQLLKTGNDIIIGTHIHFYIHRVMNCSKKMASITNNYEHKAFCYKYLLKEIIKSNTIMVGLPYEDQLILEDMLQDYLTILDDPEFQSIDLDKRYHLHLPYIKLMLVKDTIIPDYSSSTIQPRTFLIFAKDESTVIHVGRNIDMDVHINHISASRRHCRIVYEKEQWSIIDGVEAESSNGTWFGLSDFRLKDIRIESAPYKIKNGTEVKLGNSILMFKYGNIGELKEMGP